MGTRDNTGFQSGVNPPHSKKVELPFQANRLLKKRNLKIAYR
jgi:hypothetical protein